MKVDAVTSSGRLTDEPLVVHLLGTFSVDYHGQVVADSTWRLAKARALVKLLALAPGHRLPREQVVEYLWPNMDPDRVANNFHQTLHVARRAMATVLPDGAQALQLPPHDQTVLLAPQNGLVVDVEQFEDACREARRTGSLDAYYTAVARYPGPLLPDDVYEEWSLAPRRRLRDEFISLLLELSHLHEERGEFPAAIDALQRALEADPSVESIHVGLMRLYVGQGLSDQALHQYEQLEKLDRELDSEPGPAAQSLYESILMEQVEALDGPRKRSSPLPQTVSLPRSLTTFIGREREVAELRDLLGISEHERRLITITGVAGCGKTRLAIEVAAQISGVFTDGIAFVDLGALTDASEVLPAVANTLGIPDIPGRTTIQALILSLGARHTLLILDNFEQVLDAAGEVVQLAAGCPQVSVLTTSREILDVQGEHVFRLDPLNCPDPDHAITVDGLTSFSAVALFEDRVRLIQPGFRIDETNVSDVLEICRRLDGVPLAIELAAARMRTQSTSEIAAQLGRSLQLLNRGPRDLPARQRTLRNTIDWSYRLLNPAEQQLFRRLAIFRGSWTPDAAVAICGVPDLAPRSASGRSKSGRIEPAELRVRDALESLVDQNLVTVVDLPSSSDAPEPRYRMLNTIHEYAAELLRASDDWSVLRRSHAEYFRDLAVSAEPVLTGPDRGPMIERLNLERGNLADAIIWSMETAAVETGMELIGSLSIWCYRNAPTDGYRWARELLGHPNAVSPSLPRAMAALTAGVTAVAVGDLEDAVAYLREAEELVRQLDVDEHLKLKRYLFQTLIWQLLLAGGDPERGRVVHRETEQLSHELENKWALAWTQTFGGQMYGLFGESEVAAHLLHEGMALAHELDDPWIIGVANEFFGVLMLVADDLDLAKEHLQRSMRFYEEDGTPQSLAHIHMLLGAIASLLGDTVDAQAQLRQGLNGSVAHGDLGAAILAIETLGGMAVTAGDVERGATLFGAAEQLLQNTGANPAIGPQFIDLMRRLRADARALAITELGEESFARHAGRGAYLSFGEARELASGGAVD